MNYLRILATGAWELVVQGDHCGVREPIKRIKDFAEKQNSFFV